MRIPLREPLSPRYIYINKGIIHLMVPVVGGQEISTDNTCRARLALKDFFEGGALQELNAYKDALIFDIALLEAGNPLRIEKEGRLTQIEAYISAASSMQSGSEHAPMSYNNAINAYLAKPSNLYSIQLRPRYQDSFSIVINPAFSLERKNDATGTPLSALYNAMQDIFPSTEIALQDPRSVLTTAVLEALPESPGFKKIRKVLTQKCKELFNQDIDFTSYFRRVGDKAFKQMVDQNHINELLRCGPTNPATPEENIDALLDTCALRMWVTIPANTSFFYSIPDNIPVDIKTESLSIMTQFFLANLNVYCKAKGISTQNFGVILDASTDLSKDLVQLVSNTLSTGGEVEKAICTFCNAKAEHFALSRALNENDITAIQQKFERTWLTVTGTDENPHMDDFMILDTETAGEAVKFVVHQGAICANFAEVVDPVAAWATSEYFARVRTDFAAHDGVIPSQNEVVVTEIDVEIETLLTRLSESQLNYLPQTVQDECRAHPIYPSMYFLKEVARGSQDVAEAFLDRAENKQTLLKTPTIFTDYSGRTFNCTAYEYAYWAKDTHMQRMLERHMDEETRTQMLTRINAIEAAGLRYQKHGEEHCSAHFDFGPLKQALQAFVNGYDGWCDADNLIAIQEAWIAVGKAQCDIPAHVAQEYCRKDRSFAPVPTFKEESLPRGLTIYNWSTGCHDSWFSQAGLGSKFALLRWSFQVTANLVLWPTSEGVKADLAAISRLDEVRTEELLQARANLTPKVMREIRGRIHQFFQEVEARQSLADPLLWNTEPEMTDENITPVHSQSGTGL